MSLFPFMEQESSAEMTSGVQIEAIPKEYDYDFVSHKLTGQIVSGKEALKIWIQKNLATKRYQYPIYSWDYGLEIEELIGLNFNKLYMESEIKRYIKECLLVNPNIIDVTNFKMQFEEDKLMATFKVLTKYGEVNAYV